MFTYEIKSDKKDEHKYIEITGYEGSVAHLNIPDEIDGINVEAIGNHSFSGRSDLVSVSLPESIRTLYGFAFHNCRNLKKISLYDSIDDYYDGVCRQCDSLRDIEIVLNRGWFEVVRNFLADYDGNLRFMLTLPDGEKALLTFPGYVYDFNENTMARTIQFSIAGSGMFYRECVDRRSMDYRGYDRLFEKALIDGNAVSEDIAIGRVLYPVELADGFSDMYESYIGKNSESILLRLVENFETEPDTLEQIKALLTYKKKSPEGEMLLSDDGIDKAIRMAADKKLTVLSALLMEFGKSGPGSGPEVFEF
ncbi:leucine-rich repeat protein [Butyrivibrio sp. XPD2006]|uniref:leucine-rich repeat protein n=1 Tax=Butyrivibrio sp. XPD2006 TaxID=1280668 RepID=UPI000407EFF8|nr:leucine-rich repeat domain-containing protein [Butyrivibrio sp. XPD2006]